MKSDMNSYEVCFTVEAFTPNEGGMDHETYGQPKNELIDAVQLLEMALVDGHIDYRNRDWQIVCNVKGLND